MFLDLYRGVFVRLSAQDHGNRPPQVIDRRQSAAEHQHAAHGIDRKAEIAAAEPQVIDPIAFCFDSAGDLYVVESPGYPHSGKGLPESKLGRIVRLRDADQDGRFEQRTVFAQDFVFPNGIVPWNGGFFVTAAPNILYLKDTDGNGHADQRRVVLTGFNTDSSSEDDSNYEDDHA